MINIVNFLIDKHGGHYAKWKADHTEIALDSCPNCGKGDEHFNFSTRKMRGGCFSCDWRCDIIQLISSLEGISRDKAKVLYDGQEYDELDLAINFLSDNETAEPVSEVVEHKDTPLPKEFELIFDVLRTPNVIIPTAFRLRNYDPQIMARYGIGFCRSGDYNARIIFPIKTGLKFSFTGRAIQPTQPKKYRHPSGSLMSKLLFGHDNVFRNCKQLYVVEGPTDVLRLACHGLFAVCTFGKKISVEQIRLISKKDPQEVICVFDGDAIEQNIKAFQKLSMRLNASYVLLPRKENGDFYDPDDVPKETLFQLIERRIGLDDLMNTIRILSQL